MLFIKRKIDIQSALAKKSIFLFGPRQTGKTSLIRNSIPKENSLYYNLLENDVFFRLSQNLSALKEDIQSHSKSVQIVIIDEIQKLPELLDEVHSLIEEKKIHFLLTGSSAVKLYGPGINLLAGRARQRFLHPFIFHELGCESFRLIKAINRGLIPSIYFSDDPETDLKTYIGTYLSQEIALVASKRNISSFSRFLGVAASCNSQILNYTQIGSDAGVSRKTVVEYFEILKQTLLGYELPAWNKSTKRKALETSKFYFFDTGVVRVLRDLPAIKEKSSDFGEFFETYIFHELKSYIDYCCPYASLAYWRSTSNFEVDFVLNNETAIEVKAKSQISTSDLKGIYALKEECLLKNYIVVSLEETSRNLESGICIIPWKEFLNRLWKNEFVTAREEI